LLILVSNDDGVTAHGIQALARTLGTLGRVVVVAPDRERSAVGHALTLHKPLRVESLDTDVYSVNGTPTDCVTLAVHSILKEKPTLVVSGINRGGNLGDNITYSGTVSAAMEGALLGIPSIAVSLVGNSNMRFAEAAERVVDLTARVANHGLPPDTLLNVNVPNMPAERIRGMRVTRMGRRTFKDPVVAKTDPRGRPYYWIGGEEVVPESQVDTDYEAIEQGYISVTPLHLDMTHHGVLQEITDILSG
jgi:5'-nucleotidase